MDGTPVHALGCSALVEFTNVINWTNNLIIRVECLITTVISCSLKDNVRTDGVLLTL